MGCCGSGRILRRPRRRAGTDKHVLERLEERVVVGSALELPLFSAWALEAAEQQAAEVLRVEERLTGTDTKRTTELELETGLWVTLSEGGTGLPERSTPPSSQPDPGAEELLAALDRSLRLGAAEPVETTGTITPADVGPRPLAEHPMLAGQFSTYAGLDLRASAGFGGGVSELERAGGALRRSLLGGGSSDSSGGKNDFSGGGIGVMGSDSGGNSTQVASAAVLYVLDWNHGLVFLPGMKEYEKGGEWVDLRAQVSGGSVASYSWDLSGAPLATNVTGTDEYRLRFQWDSGVPQASEQQVVLTVTLSDGTRLSQTLTFVVEPAAGGGPSGGGGGGGGQPSEVVWPEVLEPGALLADQEVITGTSPLRPYAVELGSGAVELTQMLPGYNPGVLPVGLIYDSVAAEPDPIFLVRYELDPTAAVPDQVADLQRHDGFVGVLRHVLPERG